MSSRTIVCSDCGEAVPYGRLSCPSCGALLASVAGGARVPAAASASGGSLEPDPDDGPSEWASAPSPASGAPSAAIDASVGTGPGAYIASTAPAEGVGAATTPPAPDIIPLMTAAAPRPATARPAQAPAPTGPAGTSIRTAASTLATDPLLVWLDRAVAVGSGLIALGMLLPWSTVVIGADGIGGYFNTWGLAGRWHVLVLVAAVAVAALAVVPNRSPAWARSGLPAIGLGAFALGLIWPYLAGPLGGAIGSVLELLGALVAVVAGVLVVWQGRHIAGDAAV
jgi:hypothetical protein